MVVTVSGSARRRLPHRDGGRPLEYPDEVPAPVTLTSSGDWPLSPWVYDKGHSRTPGVGIIADHAGIGRRDVPTRRNVRGRPVRRYREEELDLADIGGETADRRPQPVDGSDRQFESYNMSRSDGSDTIKNNGNNLKR
jgi:hypothetical protein